MTRAATCLFGIALFLALCARVRAEERGLAIITHPSRQITLTAGDLRRLFMKQRRFWPDGKPVIAINQTAATAARGTFERSVFGADAAGLPAYWNRRYFEGLFPPITLGSDEAVQRYVAAKPDAVGYVDVRSLDSSVHVAMRLKVRDASKP